MRNDIVISAYLDRRSLPSGNDAMPSLRRFEMILVSIPRPSPRFPRKISAQYMLGSRAIIRRRADARDYADIFIDIRSAAFVRDSGAACH